MTPDANATAGYAGGASPLTTTKPESAASKLLNLDFAEPLAFLTLALTVIVSRIPFINIGYGTDPDAWRVGLTGYWIWEHGEYYPSRLPGYPVQELGSALVFKGGHLATNSLTLAVSLLGLWYFAAIVRHLQLPNRALLVLGFGFTPLLWINSMTTMDYMWALAFTLGAYYFILTQNSFAAGLMLGLAIGSRSTALLMFIPLAYYLVRDGRRSELRLFAVSALGVAVIAWSPIYWKYGPSFFNFYDADVGYLNVARLLGKDCLGLIGSIAVIAAVIVSLPRLASLPHDAVRDRDVGTWLIALAVAVFIFARLPHEAAYLIPVYPFGFFIMGRYFQQWVLAGVIGAIVLAGFVDLTSPGDEINMEAFTNAQLGRGLVLSNADTMRAQIDFTRDLEAYEGIQDNTVVSTGFVYPMFAMLFRDRYEVGILESDKSAISQLSDKGKTQDADRRLVFVWVLDWDNFQKFQRQGYGFLFTEDAGRSTAALHGYRPALLGAKLIDLGRNPSGGSGAARTDR